MKSLLILKLAGGVCAQSLSWVQLFATPWTVAHQAPCPGGSLGKNIGVSCHFLLQGIFLIQGSNPHLESSALAGRFFTASATWEAQLIEYQVV